MPKLAQKIVNLNYFIFPFFWVMVLCLSMVEVYFYAGFIAKHIFLSLPFFLFFAIWSGLLLKLSTSPKEQSFFYRFIKIINRPMFFLFSFLMIFLLILEARYFKNYVFSTYHLIPENIFWPWFLSLFLLVKEFFDHYVKFNLTRKFLFKTSFIFTLIIWILAFNIFTIHEKIVSNLYFILSHPLLSFEDKMKYKVGEHFFNYTLFIKKNTPENATILIPPQGYPWPQTGNVGYLRYFLRPRRLLSGKEYEPGLDLNKEKVDFVLLAFGESSETQYGFTHGWPKFNVKAKRVIYWMNESQKVIPGGFIYNKDGAQESQWGLIELERQ